MTQAVAQRPEARPYQPPALPAMVQATGVVKRYDTGKVQVRALRGVDLTITRGEMVAIMGPSGCGKTTLLNCLSGLDEIDEGEVQIEGVSLKAMSYVERNRYRARRIGFVFQFYNLLGVLTAAENVEMPLLLARVPSGEARERALRALEMVVTIARALVNDPAIVWADEPTGDLDSTRADEIINLMRRLNQEQQITFAIVTHDIGIGRRADRIVRMADGEIVGEEYPA